MVGVELYHHHSMMHLPKTPKPRLIETHLISQFIVWNILKIFNINEDIKLLKEKYELVLLDHNYLSSPKKLNEYQKKYFENDLEPIDIRDISEIDFNSKEVLIKELVDVIEDKNEK